MAKPQPVRRDADEAFSGLVIACCGTSGVLELVETALEPGPQAVERTIYTDAI